MFNQNGGYSLADIAAATGNGVMNTGGFGSAFGGDGWWVLLFLLAFGGGWGNGWGNGGAGGLQNGLLRSEISYGFDMNNLENGVRGIQNGLCDGFYAVNTGLLNSTAQLQSTMAQGFGGVTSGLAAVNADVQKSFCDNTIANLQSNATLMAQLNNMQAQDAACCCEMKNLLNTNFADLSYRMATQDCATRQTITDATRDIIASQNEGFRAILDKMTTDRIDALTAENQSLKFAQSQSNQNAFLISQLAPKAIPAYIAPNPYTGTCGYNGGCYNALNATGFC